MSEETDGQKEEEGRAGRNLWWTAAGGQTRKKEQSKKQAEAGNDWRLPYVRGEIELRIQ